jgi:hypothetical protein
MNFADRTKVFSIDFVTTGSNGSVNDSVLELVIEDFLSEGIEFCQMDILLMVDVDGCDMFLTRYGAGVEPVHVSGYRVEIVCRKINPATLLVKPCFLKS